MQIYIISYANERNKIKIYYESLFNYLYSPKYLNMVSFKKDTKE